MQVITGIYNQAVVFTDKLEAKAAEQILELCNQEFARGSRIRIMPDTHAGAGCTIGTTMTIRDKIVPNLVGVDIGCGMHVSSLKRAKVDFDRLDRVIRAFIPSGFKVRKTPHEYSAMANIEKLFCKQHLNLERATLSIGTLGGGNHFIEMNADENGELYLVIHSGSRHLGKQIAEHYQERACREVTGDIPWQINKKLESQGREREIRRKIKSKINKDLAYLEGAPYTEYLHDMRIAQVYAEYNRKAIAETIIREMQFDCDGTFTTIHNYIDMDEMILRKGAIAARAGETVIIPMNMRDGSVIATGKGNGDWNYSAPHGAGRLMSRMQAKKQLSLANFKQSMNGIYTTSVSRDTLDEAPSAYKPMAEIIVDMEPTVEILKVIKPVYNFKASEEGPKKPNKDASL